MIHKIIEYALIGLAGVAASIFVYTIVVDYLDKKKLKDIAYKAKAEIEEKKAIDTMNEIVIGLVKVVEPKKVKLSLLTAAQEEVKEVVIEANQGVASDIHVGDKVPLIDYV